MDSILEFFKYDFFKNAILIAIFSSIICGIIGTYIVSKKIVFISGGITHASFGGIGLAYFLGYNPIIGAAIFSIFIAFLLEFITKHSKIRNDSIIGILWSLGMAIGIIFIYITPGYTPNLMSYLFGSILTVTTNEVIAVASLALFLSIYFFIFYREILYTTFDENFMKTQNINTNFINYITLIFVALSIVLNIRVIGIILIISMLTVPQAISELFFYEFHKIVFSSIFFSFISIIIGLFISFKFDIPSGASIIFTLITLFIFFKTILYTLNRKK